MSSAIARIPYFQVDAFADRPFSGNPAGVCLLAGWLPDATMQAIAAEVALSATAFLVRETGGYGLRWFTPKVEEELCGHGTLGAAWVVLEKLEPGSKGVTFRTRAGLLTVIRSDDHFVLDLPTRAIEPCQAPRAGACPAHRDAPCR